MSTKIYNARRCQISQLNALLGIIRRAVIKRAAYQIGTVMGDVDRAEFERKYQARVEDWKKHGNEPPPWLHKGMWVEEGMDLCEKASAKPERDLKAALDASVNVWLHEGFAYLICYGEEYLYEKIRWPRWAPDYSYWDNTDPPDEFTWPQWRRRGRVWAKICIGHHNDTRLNHEIINFKPGESAHSRIMFRGILVPEQYEDDKKTMMARTGKK